MRLTLTKKDFSKWCQKRAKSGQWFFVVVVVWGQQIKYGNNGKRALHKYSSDPDHLQKYFRAQKLTYILPETKPVSAPPQLSDSIANYNFIKMM